MTGRVIEFDVSFVPASMFNDMLRAADEGDREAQRVMSALVAWSSQAEEHPRCFHCDGAMTPASDGGEGIGGIAVIESQAKDRQNLVGAYCPACEENVDSEQLLISINKTMEKETGLVSVGALGLH